MSTQINGWCYGTNLAQVTPRRVQWLWPGRIPTGKITLMAGDPGLGKTLITMDLAARVSAGLRWPDLEEPETRGPADVVLLSAEDDLADTIRPRLDAAGGDPRRVHALEGIRYHNEREGAIELRKHIQSLEATLEVIDNPRLLIIDPISAYMGEVDSHNNAEVRGLFASLSKLAEQFNVAVLCVSHLNKSEQTKAAYRTMGSLAFTAAARAAWMVTADPVDRSRRLLLPIKFNIGSEPTGLGFRVKESRIIWEEEPLEMHADDGLRGSSRSEHNPRQQRDLAKQWICQQFRGAPRIPTREIMRRAREDGVSEATLRRAAAELEVDTIQVDGVWTWVRSSDPLL